MAEEKPEEEFGNSQEENIELAWHQKSRGALILFSLFLVLSIGLFTALALTGLFVTFYLALPIAFALMAMIMGIKIVYDNWTSSLVTSQILEDQPFHNPVEGEVVAPAEPQKSQQIFSKEKEENVDIKYLLIKRSKNGKCGCLGEEFNLDEYSDSWKGFRSCFQDVELSTKGAFSSSPRMLIITLSTKKGFLPLSEALFAPICRENAPIIRKIIEKNNNLFSPDLKKQILEELDKPLKSIPASELDPEYTQSLSMRQ